MLATQVPTKFPVPFAQGAGPPYSRPIPVSTTDQNAASLNLGFPPNTFVNVNSGGSEPDGRDFNGILNQLAAWSQWQSAGGPVYYDATFSAAIGGYPQGALLMAASRANLWVSSVDNNISNPDTGGANWVTIGAASPNLTAFYAMSVQNQSWVYVHDTGTADALVVNPSPAVTAYVAGLRLSVLKSGNANATTTPTISVSSLPFTPIVRSNNTPIQANDLPATAIFDLEYDGASFRLLQLQPTAVRRRLAANATFFVSNTGSDVTGQGTSAAPWQTIQNAFNQIYENFDLAGFQVTIQLANGNYTAGVLWDGLFLGQIGPIVVSGNTTNPDLVHINVLGAPCFHFRYGANVFVQGFRLFCGLNGVFGGMMAEFGGYIAHDACWFDAMANCYHMYANFGTIACYNPVLVRAGAYWIYGGAQAHYYCQFNGNIDMTGVTVNAGANCSFSTFCNIPNGNWFGNGARFLLGAFAFLGQRYLCQYAGLCNTFLGGANFFPGSIAGTAPTGFYI